MKRIQAQCSKELRQFSRDRLTVALAFALPLLSLFLYGFATRLEIKNIPIVVQNFDNSLTSRSLIERLFANDQFMPTMWAGKEVIRDALNTGSAAAAIVIPPEFDRLLHSGRVSPIEALIDGTDVNNARVIKNSLIATTDSFLIASGLTQYEPAIKADVRLWFNPGRKESLYVVPGSFGVILWIYPALLAALAMAREREQGTILQAYTSGLTALELIAGKVLAYLIVGLAEALVLILVSSVVFGISLAGDPMLFTLSTLLYVVDATLFGLLIAIGAATQSAAVQSVAFGGFTPALLLSGYLYPVRNIKYPLSLLANIVPARYYIELSRDTFVRGSGWAGQWHVPLVLAAIGVFFFIVASKRLGRMQISA